MLVIVGLVGVVLPALPGTILIFAGLLMAAWADGFMRVGGWTLKPTKSRHEDHEGSKQIRLAADGGPFSDWW